MKNSVVNIVIYGYEKGIIVNALNNLRTASQYKELWAYGLK